MEPGWGNEVKAVSHSAWSLVQSLGSQALVCQLRKPARQQMTGRRVNTHTHPRTSQAPPRGSARTVFCFGVSIPGSQVSRALELDFWLPGW